MAVESQFRHVLGLGWPKAPSTVESEDGQTLATGRGSVWSPMNLVGAALTPQEAPPSAPGASPVAAGTASDDTKVTHMRTRRTSIALAAIGLTAGLTLSACGSDDSGSSTDDSGDGGSARLDGVSITVGSKDFTENILLGEMLVQAMESEGADVTNQTNLGGTSVNREALLSGEINVYPEYNGTGWTVHLGQQDPSQDPEELFNVTAEKDLADNDIAWVGQLTVQRHLRVRRFR